MQKPAAWANDRCCWDLSSDVSHPIDDERDFRKKAKKQKWERKTAKRGKIYVQWEKKSFLKACFPKTESTWFFKKVFPEAVENFVETV